MDEQRLRIYFGNKAKSIAFQLQTQGYTAHPNLISDWQKIRNCIKRLYEGYTIVDDKRVQHYISYKERERLTSQLYDEIVRLAVKKEGGE